MSMCLRELWGKGIVKEPCSEEDRLGAGTGVTCVKVFIFYTMAFLSLKLFRRNAAHSIRLTLELSELILIINS